MDRLSTCTSQTKKTKYSDMDSASSAIRKSNKKSKTKKTKRKDDKKESKKRKKWRKYSTSSSSSTESDSDEYEWVEKKVENQTSSHTSENSINNKTQGKRLEREEWMNIESFVPCISKSDMRKERSNAKEEDKVKTLSYKPEQSDRELNPYWKDGGNGLPQNCSEKRDNQPILDANWLKKSFRRAEEQALRDGRSLEEVAAERWGSLETIQSMIAKAEKMSNSERYGIRDERHNNDRSNKDFFGASTSNVRSHLGVSEGFKSRDREQSRKYNTCNYSSQHTERKYAYRRPKETDDYYRQNVNKSSNSQVERLKKVGEDITAREHQVTSRETEAESISNVTEVKSIGVLSEAEMNKLGARIVKAEIMGDEILAAQLKLQLEQARTLAIDNNIRAQEETDVKIDDIFKQRIARIDSVAKQDKQDRMYMIKEHKDLSKRMDNCWWCPDSENMLKHMIVTMDSAICLSLPVHTSLTTGHCILTPTQHVACQLQLDEDVWQRLKEIKGKLTKMFTSDNFYPIFFEVYKRRDRFSHMRLECIPLQKEIGELAPMYFKKALLECETEWSINKKIVDLQHKDIRRAVPNGMSYFMVEFASHPGYAHVIEDERIFPKNFAEEIIGGMLDLDCNLWRKPKRQDFDVQRKKVLEFTKMWQKYDSSQSKDVR